MLYLRTKPLSGTTYSSILYDDAVPQSMTPQVLESILLHHHWATCSIAILDILYAAGVDLSKPDRRVLDAR